MTSIESWKRGTENIKKCLEVASRADWQDAPMFLVGEDARLWHQAQMEAYRHSLEMMGWYEEEGN